MTMKTIVYLACPYTHTDPWVMARRFCAANEAAAGLMREGLHVFSPISHTHPIALSGDLPLGWEYWRDYDLAFLKVSCKMIVLQLDGWNRSTGVQSEIAIAKDLNIPIEYMPYAEA